MAEYLIKDTTLNGIADKIRVLIGSEESMTPIEMQSDLDTHNTEMNQVLSTQDDLITQIATTLDRKITENLSDELEEQDNLIAQIALALEGKCGVAPPAIEFVYANAFQDRVSIDIDTSCSYVGFSDGGSNCYNYMKLEKGIITQKTTLGSTNYTVDFSINESTLTIFCKSSTYTGYAILAKIS